MSIRSQLNCALLVLVLACGCAHNLPRASLSTGQTVARFNAIANNLAADPDERCRAIFSLFQDFIKPDSVPHDIQAVLTDTRWLDRTNLIGIYVLAGSIPVDLDSLDVTPFVISVLPAVKPPKGRPPNLGYQIYFTLAGEYCRSEKSAFAIITGKQTWDEKAVLKQFALCYPDGTIERVTRLGTRQSNMWR